MTLLRGDRPTRPLWSVLSSREEYGDEDLPLLSMSAAYGVRSRADGEGRAPSDDLSKYRVVRTGDLVVNRLSARDGAFGRSPGSGLVSPAYWVVAVSEEMDSRFLNYLLHSAPYLAEIGRLSKFMPPAQFDLAWTHFKWLPVPVMSLEEQRRIADFLDDQVSRLEALSLLRSSQRKLVEERFADARERLLGRPRSRSLGALVAPGRPINYGILMPGPNFPGGVPLVEAGDAMRGPIRIASLRRTDPVIEGEFSRSRLRQGDLVMAIRGSVGRVQVMPTLDEICNVTRDAARISLQPGLADPNFIRHALHTHKAQDWLRLRVGGSAVQGINIGDLRKIVVPLPPLQEQWSIAATLDGLENTAEQLRSSISASERLLEERKRALITAAVTGELDVSTAGSRAAAAVT